MNYSIASQTTKNEGVEHKVILTDRSVLKVTGVKDVTGFDEHTVEVITSCGELTVDGDELKISAIDIDKGDLTLTGRVFGFYYSEKKQRKSKGLLGKKS